MVSDLPKDIQDQIRRELSAGHFVEAKKLHDLFLEQQYQQDAEQHRALIEHQDD